jgi:AbrB family looped-hinge helix DNA binding protein
MPAQAVKIIEGGKLVIPAAMRRAMGIARGDTVVVELLPDGELRAPARVRDSGGAGDRSQVGQAGSKLGG